ncbi:Crp/Fnr family transcriptional regulator [Paraflavitalea soli]|uniref:Crp/Fnr family transcriptional regulator n=1 Tax=Paraflavitalea soli TaxID=2315862 RepID=A0A3B7MGD2_9BACT|nr:Crp/Fnr family transcriptional regulator [Paraflavitalea soli]AXY73424.1 Crp/Fnr family transcriptional regulator [Paraflavitalea soli]
MFDQIDASVAKYVQLTEVEKEIFHGLLKHKKVKKKQFLLQEGEVCAFENFIIKGCIRLYFIDKEGVETILYFAVENWWVSDLASFMDQTPSNQFIETLEDCELLQLDYRSKNELLEKVPKMEKYYRILLQRSMGVLQQRFYANVSQTAEERYLAFLEKYPQVVQRVPQHQIARYIGVSPEFLSKVKSTLYKKH